MSKISLTANASLITQAVDALRRGALVAFPTETVYGLGGDARNLEAIQRIYALKGRPLDHPVIVHLAPDADLNDWVSELPPAALALADAFWPGPLTLVLPRAPGVLDAITGGQDTVALRKPAHPLAQALLSAFGGGLAGPSANRYGRISPTSAAHVREEFGAQAPLILDGGDCTVGLESTIVGWLDGQLVQLRPGQLSLSELSRVAGPIVTSVATQKPRVSGSHESHYAPRTSTSLLNFDEILAITTGKFAVLSLSTAPITHKAALWLQAPDDAMRYGQQLYATLRQLDACGCERILVERVPEGDDWAAIRDRLTRAAAR